MKTNVAAYVPERPDRFVPILGAVLIALVGIYVSLLTATVYFAARQAELADTLLVSETEVAALEGKYLARVKEVTARPVHEYGFTRPKEVHYAEASYPGFSRADM